jgi:hypothetical protein
MKTRKHFAFAVLTLLLVLGGTSSGADKTPAQTADAGKPTDVELETWRQKILHTPQPRKGCFTATYPDPAWREVPCSTEPMKIQLPKRGGGLRPAVVGNGTDFLAQVTGHISEAEGSFENVTGVTSETQTYTDTSTTPATVTIEPNGYGLQLNTDFFTTSACSSSPNPATCLGWEQFIVSSFGGAGIQYWLSPYGPPGSTCPAPHHAGCMPGQSYTDGWCEFQFSPTDPVQCVVNGLGIHAYPPGVATPLDIANVHQVKLRGRAAGVGGSATDAAIVTYGTSVFSAPGGNFFPDLGSQWQKAEFNIFGSCCGMQAEFNIGTTMDVRLAVTSGSADPPGCLVGGFTGETNNLTLVALIGPVAHTGTPSLVFRQSNVAGSVQTTCAGAITIGDTHITTFDGVYYDFQASGDFLLAQDGPDFVVQARQASGAPTWPNAAVNKAIATRMGGTRVAVYIEPTRLDVDGVATALADGATILRPTGVQVSRKGNVYSISDERGNSVRATLNSTWIDVAVGLGLAPRSAVRGLLGNPGVNGQELVTADGVVLKAPVLFRDLYKTYAESWSVPPKESLFTGAASIKFGIPAKPFYASDLTREQSARALATCKAAGVKNAVLLDSCVLDTTVLNDKAAVKAFVGVPAPRYVIKPILKGKQDRDRDSK